MDQELDTVFSPKIKKSFNIIGGHSITLDFDQILFICKIDRIVFIGPINSDDDFDKIKKCGKKFGYPLQKKKIDDINIARIPLKNAASNINYLFCDSLCEALNLSVEQIKDNASNINLLPNVRRKIKTKQNITNQNTDDNESDSDSESGSAIFKSNNKKSQLKPYYDYDSSDDSDDDIKVTKNKSKVINNKKGKKIVINNDTSDDDSDDDIKVTKNKSKVINNKKGKKSVTNNDTSDDDSNSDISTKSCNKTDEKIFYESEIYSKENTKKTNTNKHRTK